QTVTPKGDWERGEGSDGATALVVLSVSSDLHGEWPLHSFYKQILPSACLNFDQRRLLKANLGAPREGMALGTFIALVKIKEPFMKNSLAFLFIVAVAFSNWGCGPRTDGDESPKVDP